MGWVYPAPVSLEEKVMEATLELGMDSISGSRVAVVDFNDLAPLVRFILGEVIEINGNEFRFGADNWPNIPVLRAQKISVKAMGQAQVSNWLAGPQCTKLQCTISYGVDPTRDDQDENDNAPEDVTNLIQSVDFGVEILTVPMKIGSGSTAKTANRHIRIPTITYNATIPRVLRPKWDKINDYNGKVNTIKVFGGVAGTVLFDGAQADREIKALSKPHWKVSYKFIYNKNGWNKQLNPDTLVWEDAFDVKNGTKPPYESANLKDLFAKSS